MKAPLCTAAAGEAVVGIEAVAESPPGSWTERKPALHRANTAELIRRCAEGKLG